MGLSVGFTDRLRLLFFLPVGSLGRVVIVGCLEGVAIGATFLKKPYKV